MTASVPKGYKMHQVQNFTPEQMGLFKDLFAQLGPDSYLMQLLEGNPELFDQIEAPALKQFSEVQGNLGSRFSGQGMGGRKSSGFLNTLNQAGSEFAQGLQSQRQGLQQQALQNLMSFSNQLLNAKPYENILEKKQQKPGFFQQLMEFGAPIVGAWAGGPGGAIATKGLMDWWKGGK